MASKHRTAITFSVRTPFSEWVEHSPQLTTPRVYVGLSIV
jgi:hypothetical protein